MKKSVNKLSGFVQVITGRVGNSSSLFETVAVAFVLFLIGKEEEFKAPRVLAEINACSSI